MESLLPPLLAGSMHDPSHIVMIYKIFCILATDPPPCHHKRGIEVTFDGKAEKKKKMMGAQEHHSMATHVKMAKPFQADLVTLVAMLLKEPVAVIPFLLSDRKYDHHTHT